MRIMKNRKCIKIMCLTLLLLSGVCFLSFPTTFAKYIKLRDVDSNPALTYTVNFKSMIGKVDIARLQTSTDIKLKYYHEFNRRDSMLESDTKDSYEISLSDGCSIDSILINDKSSNLVQDNKIHFTKPGTEKVRVNISCTVDKIKTTTCPTTSATECLVSNMTVKEYFNDDAEKVYEYGKGSFEISSQEYQELFGKDSSDIYSEDYRTYTMNKNRENKTGGINTWLHYVSAYYGYTEEDTVLLVNYIIASFSKVNNTSMTDNNLLLINNIDGISAEKDADGNYKFFLEDYFTSYAKTYKKRTYRQYYFHKIDGTVADKGEVDNLFLYYIDKYSDESQYLYDKDSVEYQFIKDYLAREEKTGETVLDLAQRLKIGLTYDSNEKYLIISDRFYSNIREIISTIKLDKGDSYRLKLTTLSQNLSQTILSEKLISQITATNPDSKVVEKLRITDVNQMFDEYVTFTDGENNIKVHIYSNDTESTCIEIRILSPIKLGKGDPYRVKLTALSQNLSEAGLSQSLISQISSSDESNKVYEYLQVTDINQMFDDYAYFTDGDTNIELHIYSNNTDSVCVGFQFIESYTTN